MLTLGIDLASKPENTAACLVEWNDGTALVRRPELGVTDERLLTLAEPSDKVGIDVPFGWPDAFILAVNRHRRRQHWPPANQRSLRYRRTDLFVRERTGRWPLSVSSDRIAMPAFRAAHLLSVWQAARDGQGKFVEVYPRAARQRFDLGATRSVRELRRLAPWLRFERGTPKRCSESEHCFDALIASLVARAAALNLCEPIPDAEVEAAAREGWIMLPAPGSLERLAG